MVFLMTNFLINLDLYFVLKNPFYPIKKRTLGFWKCIIFSSIIYTLAINGALYFDKDINQDTKNCVFFFLVVVNFYTSIRIFKGLKREGTSRNLIKRVIFNWLGLMVISTMNFLITPVGLNLYKFISKKDENNLDFKYQKIYYK